MELLIVMALMGLVAMLMHAMFYATGKTQSHVQTAVVSTGQAQSVATQLNRNIRTATAMRVTSSSRLDLKTSQGRCETWFVRNGKLYLKQSTTANNDSLTGARERLTVRNVSGASYFSATAGTGVQYAFNAGTNIGRTNLVSTATPRTGATTPTPCW